MTKLLPALGVGLCCVAFVLTACTPDDASTPTPSAPAASGTTRPSATPTQSSSPTTSPTTASGSASTALPSNGSALPALVETYCTTTQRLCFRYPAGYQVAATPRTVPAPGEDGTLTGPDGTVLLYFSDGISGIGGGCDKSGERQQVVVSSKPSRITGLPTTENWAAGANAVSMVAQPAGGSGFAAQQFLTRDKRLMTAGTPSMCGWELGDVFNTGQPNAGAVHFGAYRFSQSVPTYATADEARKQLTTPDALLRDLIMQSATVG